ncbi:MAG: hypothetical protein Alpg2KO_04730 [Alphaproteobacteria bacterium]
MTLHKLSCDICDATVQPGARRCGNCGYRLTLRPYQEVTPWYEKLYQKADVVVSHVAFRPVAAVLKGAWSVICIVGQVVSSKR